jgi:hypothetical protein
MTRILSTMAGSAAVALVLALGTPASAQDAATEEVRAEVSTALAEMGMDVEGGVESLTDEQVLEIATVLDSTDTDQVKEEQIELILAE